MVRLDISPTFLASCYFLLQEIEGRLTLTFCKERFEFTGEEEVVWQVNISSSSDVTNVLALAKAVVSEAQKDSRVILDGVGVMCTLLEAGIERRYKFRSPQKNSTQLLLVDGFLQLGQQTIKDQSFVNYIELLEGYFPNKFPIKFFHGNPDVLRIYGFLSTNDKVELEKAIHAVSAHKKLLVDMTNFESMGTLLYQSFKPLNQIKNLKFLANKNAVVHLKKIGFDEKKIEVVS